jgi:hypothetical protein
LKNMFIFVYQLMIKKLDEINLFSYASIAATIHY